MVHFSQKLEYPCFVQKKIQLEESHCTGEKARHIPQLLQARADKVEVAPYAKNSSEVICVYRPP